jgi:hypothetical protein
MNRIIPLTAAAALLAVAFASSASPAGAQSPGPFANCDAAYAAGRANIPKGDPAYAAHLDGNGPGEPDGIACENPPWGDGPAPTTPPVTGAPAPAPTTAKKTTPTTRPGAVRATPKFTG